MTRTDAAWSRTQIGAVITMSAGQVDPREDPYIDYPHVGPENIESDSGRLTGVQIARELNLVSGKYLFDEDAIVYCKIRPNLNKVCIPGFKGICSADAYPLWPNRDVICADYLLQFLRSPLFVEQATAVSMRTGMPKINQPDLKRLWIILPPLAEQKAIAGVLSAWDRAIEQTTALIAAKQRLKQGLMQQLLTGQRRFKGFKGEWRECHLGDVVEEVRRYVTVEDDTQYRLVSVRRNSGGLFDREPRPGREIGYSKLMTVEDGDFLIARRQVIHGAMTIVRKKFHGAFVSDAYAALVPKRKNELHMPFLDILSRMPRMYYSAFRCSYGVAIEKMVFHLEWFLRETIHIPPTVDEQVKLASLFAEIDRELKQLQRRVTSLQKQKRGLMQKLLTGKVRVSDKLLKQGAKS